MTGKTEDGAPYMVLEYLPGCSLDERLRDGGPIPWREAVQVATQVARALEVLHRLGVIHRDVKPSNIMQLDSATGQLVVKLLDLGIAKVHDWQRVQAAGFDGAAAPPDRRRQGPRHARLLPARRRS
jgi:serine/threonine protein kinase